MTLGEGKRKVLMLIDEYSSGGTLTVDEDLNVRMIDFFDLAQKNVANYKKIIRNFTPSSDYPLTSPSEDLVACRLPGNFVSPFRVWKNGKVTKKYVFTQNSVLIPQDEIQDVFIEYVAAPDTIPQTASDSYEFEVDEDAAACMPYFVAAQQLIVDLVVDYQPLLDLYDRMLAALDTNLPSSGGGVRQAFYASPKRRI